jgi:hypothetical protein
MVIVGQIKCHRVCSPWHFSAQPTMFSKSNISVNFDRIDMPIDALDAEKIALTGVILAFWLGNL